MTTFKKCVNIRTLPKVLVWTTFFPYSGSAAASGFVAAFAVVARAAAASPELGKNVVHLRTFGNVKK